MSVPSTYDALTLAKAMETWLGPVGQALGWSAEQNSYWEPTIDAMHAYPVDDLADATDIARLRALARVAAWRLAVEATAGRVDISGETGGLKLSQMHAQAVVALEMAQIEALPYNARYAVGTIAMVSTADPYVDQVANVDEFGSG